MFSMENRPPFITLMGSIIMAFTNSILFLTFNVPDYIPVHWSLHGNVNLTLPKYFVLFLIPIILLATSILQFVNSFHKNVNKIDVAVSIFVVVLLTLIDMFIICRSFIV